MAQRVGRDIALLFHDRGTRRGEWSAARPGCTLPPEKTWYPVYRRLGGPQGRSGGLQQLQYYNTLAGVMTTIAHTVTHHFLIKSLY